MPTITPAEGHLAETVDEKTDDAILATAEEASDNAEDTPAYYEGWAFWNLGAALMGSAFLLSLDNTILGMHSSLRPRKANLTNIQATAIPRITSDFNSLNDIGWYASAYKITQMSLLPLCGRIYTFYDNRWSYIIVLLIFELGSIICAVAQNSTTLIVGRAVSGVGAAGLMSGAAIIISATVTLRKRPVLMGLISIIYGVASVLGPLVGGAITDNSMLTWRFCFWINLPFGAVGLAQIWFALRTPPKAVKSTLSSKEKISQMGFPGATILIGSITCLLLALQWGGIDYSWSDPKVYGTLIVFGLTLILFIMVQWRFPKSSTVPIYLFKNRTVVVASIFMMFLQLSITVITYYWPLYFQSVKNTSAENSGIYMLPFAISTMFSTFVAGWVISKVGYYVPFMWVGAPILAAGAGLFRLLDAGSSAASWAGYQIVSGIGYGICGQVPIIAVQVVVDKEDVPTACVLVIFFECLGATLGPSIAQNLFTDTLLKTLLGIAGVDGPAVVAGGAKGFRPLIRPDLLDRVIDAWEDALWTAYLLAIASSAAALVVSAAMEWRRLPEDKKQTATGSEQV
uniref:Putative HC-toxin efflux carrier TOXA n=1 Tax=Talaromyces marneffei PM1 TaxID=1077442 RepID=A0A093UTS5_TALMA